MEMEYPGLGSSEKPNERSKSLSLGRGCLYAIMNTGDVGDDSGLNLRMV